MEKALKFLVMFLSLMGFVGGIGYTLYCSAWVITLGVFCLGYMSYPRCRDWFNDIQS